MRYILNMTKIAIVGAGLLAVPSFAQAPADLPYTGTADRSVGDTDGGNWGWVGLLGLAGLFGLRRPSEYRTRTDMNPMGSRT